MVQSQNLPESVFIFGCGYVGTALAQYLISHGVRVGALTRNPKKAAMLRELGINEVIEAELDTRDWHSHISDRYLAVVNCVSSAGGGIDGYLKSYVNGQRSILEWAKSQSIMTYVYTSSTSVYPQDGGMVVDEEADTREAPPTGKVILESEQLLARADYLGRWFVLRLVGIYGPGRHYLLDQLRETNSEIPGSGEYALNMIHLEDIVGAICATLRAEHSIESGIFNIADDTPSTKVEVLTWLANELGLAAPIFNSTEVPEGLKHRGGRVRDRLVSNAKARERLGWKPRYPSYREGYAGFLP